MLQEADLQPQNGVILCLQCYRFHPTPTGNICKKYKKMAMKTTSDPK